MNNKEMLELLKSVDASMLQARYPQARRVLGDVIVAVEARIEASEARTAERKTEASAAKERALTKTVVKEKAAPKQTPEKPLEKKED